MSPVYAYKCPEGHVFDEIRKVDKRQEPGPCPTCGKPGELQLSSPKEIVYTGKNPEGWCGKSRSRKFGRS